MKEPSVWIVEFRRRKNRKWWREAGHFSSKSLAYQWIDTIDIDGLTYERRIAEYRRVPEGEK